MAIVRDRARQNSPIDLPVNVFDHSQQQSFIPGRWYSTIEQRTAAGAAGAANTIRMFPFFVKQRIKISDLAARITTAAAGGLCSLAIYATDPDTNLPTTLVGATGNLATDAADLISGPILGGAVYLNPGLYFMATNKDTTGAAAVFYSPDPAVTRAGALIGSETLSNINAAANNTVLTYVVNQTFGTWPSPLAASAVAANNTAGLLFFKVSSL